VLDGSPVGGTCGTLAVASRPSDSAICLYAASGGFDDGLLTDSPLVTADIQCKPRLVGTSEYTVVLGLFDGGAPHAVKGRREVAIATGTAAAGFKVGERYAFIACARRSQAADCSDGRGANIK